MGDPSGEDEAVWARQEALESGTWANCSHGRGVPADSWAQEDSRLPNNCFFNGCCFHLRHFFPWSSNFFHRLGITGNQLHEVPSFRSCCHIFFGTSFCVVLFFGSLCHLAWQAWHLEPPTVLSRGRRGTWRDPPSFRVAGVALGDIHHRFAWQAWHLATSSVVSRGRRGTWRHPPSFRVAGVALGDSHHRFAWQAWHLARSTIVSRGRRGTWRHPPSFRVAGVALVDSHHRFAWQAWHLVRSTIVSRGRRGTWNHPPSFRVAGVALGDSTIVSRGRRGTWRHPPSFHVAGVSHPGRIKIDELPSAYTMAMHKIQTVGAGICSRCRLMSGCLACDPHKCTSYWMRRESARLGRPIDDEYKKSWGSISCSWAKRPWDSRHEPCSKKNWLHQQDH